MPIVFYSVSLSPSAPCVLKSLRRSSRLTLMRRPTEEFHSWRWANQHQAVLSTCSSLIAVVDNGDSKVVQFSHFSVKEYLTSDRLVHSSGDIARYHIALLPAHTILTQACLCILFRLNIRDTAGDPPLSKYAAQYWFDQAQFENVASTLGGRAEYYFNVMMSQRRRLARI